MSSLEIQARSTHRLGELDTKSSFDLGEFVNDQRTDQGWGRRTGSAFRQSKTLKTVSCVVGVFWRFWNLYTVGM